MKLYLRRTLVLLDYILSFYESEDKSKNNVGQATNIGEI